MGREVRMLPCWRAHVGRSHLTLRRRRLLRRLLLLLLLLRVYSRWRTLLLIVQKLRESALNVLPSSPILRFAF